MKKIFFLLAVVLCVSCDDGDMTLKTFNFNQNAAPERCGENNVLFKINGTEVLLLDIDQSNFQNIVNTTGKIVAVDANTKLIYRNYSGTINATVLCAEIPPASPVVNEEWNAEAGGQIKIITTESKNESGIVTGYNHQITLINIKFTKGDEEIIITDNLFGTYTTPVGYSFDFRDAEDNARVEKCDDKNLFYKVTAQESLLIEFDTIPFSEAVTTKTITLENNPGKRVYFNVYSGNVSNTSICAAVPPITPVVTARWTATSGNLKIVTSVQNDTVYSHKFYLSDVKFTRQDNTNQSFTVGQLNGQPEDYLIGTYTP